MHRAGADTQATRSYNASARCANVSGASGSWADGLAGCNGAAAAADQGFYLATPSTMAEAAYPPMRCPQCPPATNALVTEKANGNYLVRYTPTGRGSYSVLG